MWSTEGERGSAAGREGCGFHFCWWVASEVKQERKIMLGWFYFVDAFGRGIHSMPYCGADRAGRHVVHAYVLTPVATLPLPVQDLDGDHHRPVDLPVWLRHCQRDLSPRHGERPTFHAPDHGVWRLHLRRLQPCVPNHAKHPPPCLSSKSCYPSAPVSGTPAASAPISPKPRAALTISPQPFAPQPLAP